MFGRAEGAWSSSGNPKSVPTTVASHVKTGLKNVRQRSRFGSNMQWFGRSSDKAELRPIGGGKGATSIIGRAKVSDSGAYTTRQAAFETVESAPLDLFYTISLMCR